METSLKSIAVSSGEGKVLQVLPGEADGSNCNQPLIEQLEKNK